MKPGKPAKKYSQAARVHDVIRLIEARHGVTVEELVEETGVDRRTIYRDLGAIHDAGYPLVSEWSGGSKVYRFLTRFKDVPPVTFTLPELMTLCLLRSQAGFLAGTPFHDDMEGIFRKINSVLPPRYAAHLDKITRSIVPRFAGHRDYSSAGKWLVPIRDALLFQQRIFLSYDARGKGAAQEYHVEPYTLIFHKGGLYLLGFALNRNGVRTFAVERITEVRPTSERFQMPEGYRPEEALDDAFGIVSGEAVPVKVRFSSEVAHSVRGRKWHPAQEVVEGDDGSVTVSFQAGGALEIVSWILSYGRHAELLEPASLRVQLAEHAAALASFYAGEEGPTTAPPAVGEEK